MVDFRRRFIQQKQPAAKQYGRLASDRAVNSEEIDVEPRGLHRDQPRDAEQQNNAQKHGQGEADIRAFGCSCSGNRLEMIDKK